MNALPDQPVPTAPSILFSYQGAYLPVYGGALTAGAIQLLPAIDRLGIGYAVARQDSATVPVTTVRTASIKDSLQESPDNVVQMGYLQNDTEWLMTFSILSDVEGGLIGTDFALDTHSNYPQIPMNMGRTRIKDKGINWLVKAVLPADYRAQIVLRFWNNGLDKLPLDGWLAVQIGYVKVEQARLRTLAAGAAIPLVTVGELLFYPAPGSGDNPVIGNNYPKANRHVEPRMVTF